MRRELSILELWRRVSDRARRLWGPISGPGLNTLLGVIALSGLIWALLLMLAGAMVRSETWDLPSGALLEQALSSCQIEHAKAVNGGEVEHMICPTALSAAEFPVVLKQAVVASEDSRFYSHGAIDLHSAARAAWHSISGDREGGSTITQQLARSLFLKKEDSFNRKLLEAVLAIRIYAALPRNEILTRYLNSVPHARNMYGFDAPARYYFGVPARDLNLAEAALLVGMLPEPNNRDPVAHQAASFDGASLVLDRMRESGRINAEQGSAAKAELKRRIFGGALRRGEASAARIDYRPYRDLALREARANGMSLGDDYRLIVFIDDGLQRNLVRQLCAVSDAHQAAGIFMRSSGEVLAAAGSCAYTGSWNRATDITRSIGSTGKLFPLIGVHEAGIDLGERVSTRPLRGRDWPSEPNSRCLATRTVSLDFALAQSCNRPWTEMALWLGPKLTSIVARFDIGARVSPALVPIGGIQSSPMKLAQSYAALKNDGLLPQVRYLAAAIGPKGNIIGVSQTKPLPRVMSRGTAAAVLGDLRGPVKRGTARAANSIHALVYGKTGTSSRNEDALFVGLTENFVGSLWLGHDRPWPMPGVHGGGAPAKAFGALTDYYYTRLARARAAPQEVDEGGEWIILGGLEPVLSFITVSVALGFVTCLLLLAVFHRRQRSARASSAIPANEQQHVSLTEPANVELPVTPTAP